MKRTKKSAFTLAEVLIALTILGVIASLTIPTVIQKQREAANRTKIKKSMKVFDFLMSKLVTENNFHSAAEIKEYIGENCQKAPSLFKIAHTENNNNCTFVTSDGVYWNISDIMNPLVSVGKNDERNAVDNKKTFQFSAMFDKNGSLRVNDVAYELANYTGSAPNLEQLYKFINNKKEEKDEISLEEFNKAQFDKLRDGEFDYGCDEDEEGHLINIACRNLFVTMPSFIELPSPATYYYDENGRIIVGLYKEYAGLGFFSPTSLKPGVKTFVPIQDKTGKIDYIKYGCDENMEHCTECKSKEKDCPAPNSEGYYE